MKEIYLNGWVDPSNWPRAWVCNTEGIHHNEALQQRRLEYSVPSTAQVGLHSTLNGTLGRRFRIWTGHCPDHLQPEFRGDPDARSIGFVRWSECRSIPWRLGSRDYCAPCVAWAIC